METVEIKQNPIVLNDPGAGLLYSIWILVFVMPCRLPCLHYKTSPGLLPGVAGPLAWDMTMGLNLSPSDLDLLSLLRPIPDIWMRRGSLILVCYLLGAVALPS